jgi:hypothetical protein
VPPATSIAVNRASAPSFASSLPGGHDGARAE